MEEIAFSLVLYDLGLILLFYVGRKNNTGAIRNVSRTIHIPDSTS